MSPSDSADTPSQDQLHLIQDDWLFRMQQKVGLVPSLGFGLRRRALFWSMLAWLPLMICALATGHLAPFEQHESILQHFGIHVRGLLAIPVFILSEGPLHEVTTRLLPYFRESGLIGAEDQTRFRELILRIRQLHRSALPWIIILALAVVRTSLPLEVGEQDEMAWAPVANSGLFNGFGRMWFLYVSRPVFLILALAWAWKLVLLGILFFRLARLRLAIVPTHPDRLGGLGFIEELPVAFAPVVLALSAVFAAKWGHDVVYHQQAVAALKPLMVGMALTTLVIFLAPYLAFSGCLRAAKKQALLDYGRLVGEQGRLVHQRWILKTPVPESELLNAPEIGPVADAAAMYQSVQAMRTLAIGKKGLMAVAIPLMIPQLILLSLQIPVKDVLLTLLKVLA